MTEKIPTVSAAGVRPRIWIFTSSVVAVALTLTALLQIDSIPATGMPALRWRWQPHIEERETLRLTRGIGDDGELIVETRTLTSSERAKFVSAEVDRQAAELRETRRLLETVKVESPVDLRPTPHDWPAFRLDGSGIANSGIHLAKNWKMNPPTVVWRQAIGPGWSSFSVVGDYGITHEQRASDEAIVCYAWRTGRRLWEHRYQAVFTESWTEEGPRATPTIHGSRVYALGGAGDLRCLDGRKGELVWRRNILEDANVDNRNFGMVGSPLVADGKVVVCPGGKEMSVVAYDTASGESLWAGGDSPAAYSSPMLATICGRKQVLNFNADGLTGHDFYTGAVRWHRQWITNSPEMNNVCQPIVIERLSNANKAAIFISSGYGVGCALLEVTRTGERFEVADRWKSRNLKAKFACAVLRDEFIYGLDDGILTCLEIDTGRRMWKQGRYGHGQLLLVEDALLILAENGDLALAAADPNRPAEYGRIPALKNRSWSFPVLIGDHVLARNNREAICVKLELADATPASVAK